MSIRQTRGREKKSTRRRRSGVHQAPRRRRPRVAADAVAVLFHLVAGLEPGCLDAADGNDDGTVAVVGRVGLLGGGRPAECLSAADANGDFRVDLADPIYVVLFLFRQGAPPPDPGPPGAAACGPGPIPPAGKDLGCGSYSGC
jgi:hypothetical protein